MCGSHTWGALMSSTTPATIMPTVLSYRLLWSPIPWHTGTILGSQEFKICQTTRKSTWGIISNSSSSSRQSRSKDYRMKSKFSELNLKNKKGSCLMLPIMKAKSENSMKSCFPWKDWENNTARKSISWPKSPNICITKMKIWTGS